MNQDLGPGKKTSVGNPLVATRGKQGEESLLLKLRQKRKFLTIFWWESEQMAAGSGWMNCLKYPTTNSKQFFWWGAAWHWGSICASHPAALGSILGIPEKAFWWCWDLLILLVRVESGQRLENVDSTCLVLASNAKKCFFRTHRKLKFEKCFFSSLHSMHLVCWDYKLVVNFRRHVWM